jgi:hypothetical protein
MTVRWDANNGYGSFGLKHAGGGGLSGRLRLLGVDLLGSTIRTHYSDFPVQQFGLGAGSWVVRRKHVCRRSSSLRCCPYPYYWNQT